MNTETPLDPSPQTPPAIIPPPLPAQRPPLWPAFMAAAAGLFAASLFGGVLVVVYLVSRQGLEGLQSKEAAYSLFQEAASDPIGFLVISLPAATAFLFAATGAALLSRGSFADLLGFRKGQMQWWLWPVFALATPFVTSIGGFVQQFLFSESSKQLDLLGGVVQESGDGIRLAPLLVVGLFVPFAEEILFRGFVQQRFLKHWKAWLAITVSSGLFLVAHLEPAHMVAILPLSFWLGVVAWRTNSVWPAILCHAAQNLLFVSYHHPEWLTVLESAFEYLTPISCAAFLVSVVAMWRHRNTTECVID